MLNPYPGPHADLLAQVSTHAWTTIGSKTDNYRHLLRQKIANILKRSGQPEAEDILNLQKHLSHPTLNMSLSHSRDASCVAWIPKPYSIGVDIEATERITKDIVQRVSSAQEVQSCPDFKLLWPAKEAVFKAISPAVQVVSEIEIFNWQEIQKEEYFFSARLSQSGKTLDGSGLVCLIPKHLLSFFIFKH